MTEPGDSKERARSIFERLRATSPSPVDHAGETPTIAGEVTTDEAVPSAGREPTEGAEPSGAHSTDAGRGTEGDAPAAADHEDHPGDEDHPGEGESGEDRAAARYPFPPPPAPPPDEDFISVATPAPAVPYDSYDPPAGDAPADAGVGSEAGTFPPPPEPAGADTEAADEALSPADTAGTADPAGPAQPADAAGPPDLAVTRPAAHLTPPEVPVPHIEIPEELEAGHHPGEIDLTNGTVSGVSPTDEYGRSRHPGATQHALPRILAIANQKGGVGKTTTTVNLSASLAEIGYRVLVVDLDPQGNATTGLGINARNLDHSVYDVMLHDTPIEDVIEPTSLRNLFVVPATIDLAGAEIELVPTFSREQRLARALEPVEPDFDFVLIDCPPSLGLLTVNALTAAGEVLVPIQCEYYALEGLSQLLRNVNLVKSNLNHTLDLSTIVLTMYDGRTKLAEQVAGEVRDHFGGRVCRTAIPRSVRLSEAPSFGQPVITFDPANRGAIAYRELAKEVSGGAPQRVR